MEKIYLVYKRDTTIGYVGRTYQPLEQRFRQHKYGLNKKDHKPLTEEMRYDPESWTIELLEESDTASEEFWRQLLTSEGWRLLNVTSGNQKPPKRRDPKREAEWITGIRGW